MGALCVCKHGVAARRLQGFLTALVTHAPPKHMIIINELGELRSHRNAQL